MKTTKKRNETIQIVVLERGWVLVGRWSQTNAAECVLEGAQVIRTWGTTAGLGQLAISGPTDATVLDPVTRVTYHPLREVFKMVCVFDGWTKICK